MLGAITGMTGSLQALETIKWLLANNEGQSGAGIDTLLGRLWLLDGRTLETRVIDLPRDPECEICGQNPEDITLSSTQQPIAEITHE